MRRFIIILLDASLERIPQSISEHPAILRDAKRRRKKPEKILLDDSIHHSAISHLSLKEKRGRPDILHFCLISALDSRLSKNLEIYVHTINDEIIWINNKTRLPRNYNRFKGLMEDLFERKVIGNGEELMKFVNTNLDELLSSIGCQTILMNEHGKESEDFLRKAMKNNIAICIGAFPHGNFREETLEVMRKHNAIEVSLGRQNLTSNYVINRILCIYEELHERI
jgi:rRNA small subunit pseudouridine methyltransferase Nep1